MKRKIFIGVLIIWLIIIATDVISAYTLHHPVFSISGQTVDMTRYYGLGYSITFFDGPTPSGFYYDSHPSINMWVYILINILMVLLLIVGKRIFKKHAN